MQNILDILPHFFNTKLKKLWESKTYLWCFWLIHYCLLGIYLIVLIFCRGNVSKISKWVYDTYKKNNRKSLGISILTLRKLAKGFGQRIFWILHNCVLYRRLYPFIDSQEAEERRHCSRMHMKGKITNWLHISFFAMQVTSMFSVLCHC